ncbi:MAG: nucleotidyltransferase domain-containing protein [Prolixibacteraceae bacterium]
MADRKKILSRIKKTVKKIVPGAKIILYGSEARGESGPDSDIDVLILVEKDELTHDDITKITYPLFDIGLDAGVLISPLVRTRKQWENRPFKTPFYLNVMNEGIVL